jgi:DMSO/TMAO reductase YedYZ molybdopterin-dependent catalytic subunit
MMPLPPGQRKIDGFPRFGTHLSRPAPPVPRDPAIEIGGAGVEPFTLPLARLATLPHRELTADFHCVAGWTATGLHWEGVTFQTFFREIIEPALHRDTAITHLTFGGLDGHRSVVALEDALADDVLIAERLDGRPLDPDHGAPARLVSPRQYGYISTKHLCRIKLHSGEPTQTHAAHPVSRLVLNGPFIKAHPRARVWEEERHAYMPARLLRPLYRLTIPFGVLLARRGSRD